MLENRSIYAVDIGTTRNSRFGGPAFAWASVEKAPLDNGVACSADIEQLAAEVERDLLAGRSVALRLDPPLFIPVPTEPTRLSFGREGNGGLRVRGQ